jgi:RNA polymerase sigma-70 factor (ECF subfamily)
VRRRIADPQRADDLVGDILVRIQQNLHSIEDRQWLHWVFRIAAVPQPDEEPGGSARRVPCTQRR